jgi:hypothetical protein
MKDQYEHELTQHTEVWFCIYNDLRASKYDTGGTKLRDQKVAKLYGM